jgi:molybdenum cofactor biosynthesis protein B
MSHSKDQKTSASFALVVTTDTRTAKEDESGRVATELIEAEGHRVASRTLVPNDADKIRAEVERLIADPAVQVILTSGGTGVGVKDKTVDTVCGILDKEMPGFGEIFRSLSYAEVGGSALLSRATAGVSSGKLIYCLPGSKNAMSLALTRLILPNVGHTLWELNRK